MHTKNLKLQPKNTVESLKKAYSHPKEYATEKGNLRNVYLCIKKIPCNTNNMTLINIECFQYGIKNSEIVMVTNPF